MRSRIAALATVALSITLAAAATHYPTIVVMSGLWGD